MVLVHKVGLKDDTEEVIEPKLKINVKKKNIPEDEFINQNFPQLLKVGTLSAG